MRHLPRTSRRTRLNHSVHQVWLRDIILAVHHLLQDARQNSGAIQLQVHPLQLAQNLGVSSWRACVVSSPMLSMIYSSVDGAQ